LTSSELQHALAQSHDAGDVVCVKFTADWCRPCKDIQTFLETLAQGHSHIHVYVTDVDQAHDLVKHFGVSSMPTFIFFRRNRVVYVLKGADENALQTTFNVISGLIG